MKAIFGVVGLVITLAIVGLLAKKQLGATRQSLPLPTLAQPAASPETPPATVRQQSQQIQQRYKESLDKAMQARPAPTDE